MGMNVMWAKQGRNSAFLLDSHNWELGPFLHESAKL